MDIGKKIGDILVEDKIISELQLKEVIRAKKFFPDKSIGEIIAIRGYASEEVVYSIIADKTLYTFINLDGVAPADQARNILPDAKAIEFEVMPISFEDGILTIATSHAGDLMQMDSINFYLNNLPTKFVVATPSAIRRAYVKYIDSKLSDIGDAVSQTLLDMGGLELRKEAEDDAGDENSKGVIRFVDAIIQNASDMGASDIHIEPFEKILRIRYRVDGVLLPHPENPSKNLQGSVIARIKIMAKMNIAERRKPQDGRIKAKLNNGKLLDLRVSALPAYRGESMVMRILDPENAAVRLDQLGFADNIEKNFTKLLYRPNGVVMLCGPTGCGKTTTLYAALQHLNKPNIKIITAEEPVEYNLYGVNQCNVNRAVGLTFERIVRAMLRQAPNVILIGEIRDLETASIAVRASLTGHLVFSTIHTNDAPSAITRLVDIGLEKFLVASALTAVLAQRLVRKVCKECSQEVMPPTEVLLALGINPSILAKATWKNGKGCRHCAKTGMKGRMGIHELMVMSSPLRKLVFEGASTVKLRQQALQDGMTSLFDDGIAKAMRGVSTVEEILTFARVAE
jgi:type IV pilus assembly protein PilB